MTSKVLAIISPPGEDSVISQARAIQAHQPDMILLLKTFFPNQDSTPTSTRLLAWIKGSRDLVDTYPELCSLIDMPYTAPFGFRPENNFDVPTVLEIDVPANELYLHVLDLEKRYGDLDFRFDILPGAKKVIAPLLIPGSLQSTKITYSLEEGHVLILHDDGTYAREDGILLSLIDRFWLTGIPIYVEKNKESISEMSSLYSALLKSQSIEFQTEKDKIRDKNRTKSPPPNKYIDLPLNSSNEIAVNQFRILGGTIEYLPDHIMKFSFDNLVWEVKTEEDDFKLGNNLEPIAANEIVQHWEDVVEVYQGVSFLVSSEIEMRSQVRRLLERELREFQSNPHKKHTGNKFIKRCLRLGIDLDENIENFPIEEVTDSEIEYLKSLSSEDLVPHLWMLRAAEVDIMTMGEFGVSMFDVKQSMWKKSYLTSEKSATQISQNVILRNKENFFIVNSTSPFERSNILHLTRLSEGREIIGERTRSQWKPTDLNLRVLNRIVRNQIKNMEKATGTKIEVLKRIMPEFFQDQTKQNQVSSISSQSTVIKNKQDAIERISKALLAHMKGKQCTWSEAATVIGRVITPEQKKQFFGRKKFTRRMAEEVLKDYISITILPGKDAIVKPTK
tara:strand:+ start:2190 stop:4043 length:1854 start_codon:yes stop_codon:yes gene_type:complete